MAELAVKGPLDGRAPLKTGAWRLAPRTGLVAWLATSRAPIDLPGALHRGPAELLLLLDAEGQPCRASSRLAPFAGETMLLQDMTAGFAFIDLTGPAPMDVIGLGALAEPPPGGSITTRLADLRVTIRREDQGLLLIVERPSADYLWDWLAARLAIADKS